jgi:hypothetical protein
MELQLKAARPYRGARSMILWIFHLLSLPAPSPPNRPPPYWGRSAAPVTGSGALPIKAGEEVIGALGVSGAPGGEKDEACVEAAIKKVADQLK